MLLPQGKYRRSEPSWENILKLRQFKKNNWMQSAKRNYWGGAWFLLPGLPHHQKRSCPFPQCQDHWPKMTNWKKKTTPSLLHKPHQFPHRILQIHGHHKNMTLQKKQRIPENISKTEKKSRKKKYFMTSEKMSVFYPRNKQKKKIGIRVLKFLLNIKKDGREGCRTLPTTPPPHTNFPNNQAGVRGRYDGNDRGDQRCHLSVP